MSENLFTTEKSLNSAKGVRGHGPRQGRVLETMARVPLPVVAALLIVGGVLALVQFVWSDAMHSAGAAEPPQWVARLTIMQVNILVPAAFIMLWARRRRVQHRLGAVAAALMLILPVLHIFLTGAAILWGAILRRGDMTYPFMYVETPIYLSYLGVILAAIAWMLDRDTPRLIGPLMIIGFVLNYIIPGGMLLAYTALAVVVLRTRLKRRGTVPARATTVK